MAKLLEATSNILTDRKNVDSYNTDSMLQAARGITTLVGNTAAGMPTVPLITLHPDAESEAEKQNHFTQAIMGQRRE